MGIRISRKIGYFLKASDCKKLLIPDYQDMIDDLIDDDFFSDMLLNRLFAQPQNDELIDPFDHHLFIAYLPKKSSEEIIRSLMSFIYMCDDYKGILFQTIDLNSENRRDTCLDYYDKPFKFECKYLNRGIYPYDEMRTTRAIESSIFNKQYQANQRIDFNVIKAELFHTLHQKGMSHEAITKLMDSPTQLFKAIKKMGNYYPEVAPQVKWLIHSLELNKDNVSTHDIIQRLEPAIITTWG